MAHAIRDLLVVVEHEDEVLADGLQIAQEGRDDRLEDLGTGLA